MKALIAWKAISFNFQWVKNGVKTCNLYNSRMINHLNLAAQPQNPENLCEIFDKRPQEAVVTWTSRIAEYVKMGFAEEALESFCQMHRYGVKPNQFTFSTVLKPCTSLAALKQGRQLHAHIIKSGFGFHIFVASSLVVMYAKCKIVEDACKVFDEMPLPDAVSWSAVISGCARNGYGEEALKLFGKMLSGGMKPNDFTVASALTACAGIPSMEHGMSLHALIIETGLDSDVFVGSAIVDMYAKCGFVDDARTVFDEMPERDDVSWNAMIAGYAQNGFGEEALDLFCRMQSVGIYPSQFIFASVIKACASRAMLEQGKVVHAQSIKFGCALDVFVGSALVDMYAKCEGMDDACLVFDNMTRQNVVSYNTIITGHAHHGNAVEALKIFSQMLHVPMKPDVFTIASVLSACAVMVTPDQGLQIHAHIIKNGFDSSVFVANALVDTYAKCGSMDNARNVFDSMSDLSAIPWTTMISGYTQNGYGEEALKFFRDMQWAGGKPDEFTFSSALRTCASLAAMEYGNHLYASIIKTGFESDRFVGSSLVDMYSKCGRVEDACRIFDNLPGRSVVSWNAMITGYAQHGLGKQALELFEQMKQAGMKPTHVTFIGVLYACSHVGLVDEGIHFFEMMTQEYGITPRVEHYTCMVDLLGRAGYLYDAESFIYQIPFEPGAVVWRSLLSACRVHGNVEIGERAAGFSLKLEPQEASTYVLLSNVYSAAGRWDDVAKVRNQMKENGVKKEPGRSWIEVKNRVHEFTVEDRSHPQMEEIYARLELLLGQMKVAGYRPDTTFALCDVEHEQKES